MALNKPMAGVLLLAGAAGGPYFLFETDAGNSARQGIQQVFTGSSPDQGWLTSEGQNPVDPFWGSSGLDNSNLYAGDATEEIDPVAPVHALREVLRFDISPNWVPNRFHRVTTVLADTQLDGLRVPLVTGTTPSDLAGTLTYYFDQYKRVQRVTVHGVCGDPTRFVAELQHAYQFQQQPSLGGGLYLLKWNGRPTSVVYTEAAPVINANSQFARYKVFIELNQGGLQYGMSHEAQQLLAAGKESQRWE